jgi:hypothetical protein
LLWLVLNVAAMGRAQEPEDRVEHLLQAAVHLEQAGLAERAAEIRALLAEYDEPLKRRLLEQKHAQLRQLQAEVDQLQRALDALDKRARIALRLKVLELPLDQAGMHLVSVRHLLDSQSPTTVLETGGGVLRFLDMLQVDGFAKVVATRTLVTRDGQLASLNIDTFQGPQVSSGPAAPDAEQSRRGSSNGLRFQFTPRVGQEGSLRLDLAIHPADKPADASSSADGQAAGQAVKSGDASPVHDDVPPAVPSSGGVRAEVQISAGQTLVVACRPTDPQSNNTAATLLLLECEILPPSQP